MKNNKQNIFILIYYVILLLVMISRKDATSEPSMVLRLAFMAALIFPTISYKTLISYPVIITLFYTLTIFGFAFSYMPYTYSIYVGITFGVVLIFRLFAKTIKKNPMIFIVFTFYILIVNIVTSINAIEANIFENVFYSFLLILLFLIIIGDNIEITINQFPLCFVIITIVLSYAFLTNRQQFATDFGGGLERSGWTDPNYFGTVLGMGTVVSLLNMFEDKWKNINIVEKVLYITSIAISIPTLLLNASRGAILSVITVFVLLMMFSRLKSRYKIIFILLSFVGIVYLYTNEYFTLLEYRIMNDDGTGSGRTDIWISKLQCFFDGNIFQIIFGNGFYGGATISGRVIGFHNDFIGFLVDYGIVGFFMLLYMLYYPLKLLPKKSKSRIKIFAIIGYLCICFLTLEPFLTGILPYFSFYLYAFLLAKKERVDKKMIN